MGNNNQQGHLFVVIVESGFCFDDCIVLEMFLSLSQLQKVLLWFFLSVDSFPSFINIDTISTIFVD